MAQSGALLSRPTWSIVNSFTLPILSDADGDGSPTLRSLITISLPIVIFLDTLLGENTVGKRARSLGEDQLNIFSSIESTLASLGVEGRPCLLRLICEMQENPIGRYTVIGEVLSVLLTPKRDLSDFLHDYIEAEEVGRQNQDCSNMYSKCPFSIINAIKNYNKYMQKYSTHEDRPSVKFLTPSVANSAHLPSDHI
ncbi:uncharacterized protein LOC143025751 [Oratosquilla oratoria]|uniref:uncharacterized protein LOC143025751 n=1 Tax=Oratosquilla oratoria TaxID=337810 RepID=UPI003F7670C8